MKPTDEQIKCVEEFSRGEHFKINAFAGSGKTSTLIQISESAPRRRGTFLAFNKSIAEEAKRRFPSNVSCSTVHGLAFRAMREFYSIEKMTNSVNGAFLASKMGLKGYMLAGDVWSPRKVGFLVNESVKRHMRSGRLDVSERDVAVIGKLEHLDEKYIQQYKKFLLPHVKDAWERMQDPSSDIPLSHDGYLKRFQLSNPTIPGDFVMLDEAQDTNGVVLAMVRDQRSQMVAVGDAWQAIYAWRGATNAMTDLPYPAQARLTLSFRFGDGLADYASQILRVLGEKVPIKGNPAKETTIGFIANPRAVLARTNGGVIAELIDALEDGLTPCIVGGTSELLSWVSAAEKLMAGRSVESPLELYGFASWQEVVDASKEDEGKDLRRWVSLIEKHGTAEIRRILERLPKDEEKADLVLSTGHKAKGREWETVRLCDDFLMGASEDEVKDCPTEELRLFYVAATRAMSRIRIPETLHKKLEKVAEFRGAKCDPLPYTDPIKQSPAKPVPQFAESLFA